MSIPEYELYNQISREVQSGDLFEPAWRHALLVTGSDRQRAIPLYMNLRLEQLRHEYLLNNRSYAQPARAGYPGARVGGQRAVIDDKFAYPAPRQTAAPDNTPAPWSRWMAKVIDFSVYSLFAHIPAALVLTALMRQFAPDAGKPMQLSHALEQGVLNIAGIASSLASDAAAADAAFIGVAIPAVCFVFLLMQIIDAFVLHFFGTSPGRLLMRIRVNRPARASLATAMARNLKCLWRGLLLGLPVLPAFTMAHQYGVISRGAQTSWDKDTGYRVSYGNATPLNWILAIVVLAVCWKLGGTLPLFDGYTSAFFKMLTGEVNYVLPGL